MTDINYRIVPPALALGGGAVMDTASIPLKEGKYVRAFSIAFWFKPMAYPAENGGRSVFEAHVRSESGQHHRLVLRFGHDGFYGVFPSRQNAPTPLKKPLELGQWVHLALIFSGDKLTMFVYVPSEQRHYTAVSPIQPLAYRLELLYLCGRESAHNWFAELRLWAREKTPEELIQEATRSLIGNEWPLIGYWRIDEGQGRMLVDSAHDGGTGDKFGNDGVMVGGRWQADSGLEISIGLFRRAQGDWTYREGGRMEFMKHHGADGHPGEWLEPLEPERELAQVEALLRLREPMARFAEHQSRLAQRGIPEKKESVSKLEGQVENAERDVHLEQEKAEGEMAEHIKRIEADKAAWLAELSKLEKSPPKDLKDLIFKVQEGLAKGRNALGSGTSPLYGLATASLEIRMMPGPGGRGVYLPSTDMVVDPDRLSTLKLRFREMPEEPKGAPVKLPAVWDASEDYARRKLEQAGFSVAVAYQEVADSKQEGRVLDVIKPTQGAKEMEMTVTIIVGRGPAVLP
ncbi:LamG-like jellyroll fold domain-containing protein [Methyloterricola oryzae]|uniref:LamG-like jellyroll fold domain-containing protein n=1 Tax=Methyloterricola oryzae TaxID=1495050 RepID=UPI0005EB7746|nr:LamG-like jellyroll fold domain-containing protein [Methyloterricola oryzae]